MALNIENTSGGPLDIDDFSINLANGEIIDLSLRIEPLEIAQSANGGDLDTLINSGEITVKDPIDGTTTLSIADGLAACRAANETHWRVGSGARLNDISDVDLPSPSDGQVLAFNSTSGNWESSDPGGTPSDQPHVQTRRTTDVGFSTSWEDITLDATDEENDPSVVEHDNTNTDRILLKEAGPYWVWYRLDVDQSPIENHHAKVRARVRANDTGADLPGSFSENDVVEDSSLVGDAIVGTILSAGFIYNNTGTDFLTLQRQKTQTSGDGNIGASGNGIVFGAIRLSGQKGNTGPIGPAGNGPVLYYADQFEVTNNSDWAVNAAAEIIGDSNNAALIVARFDDTIEEGVGFSLSPPSGTASLKFTFVSKANVAPAGSRTVGLKLYNRGIPDNAAVEAWNAGTVLTDIDIPANSFFQYDTQTISLSTLGVTVGQDTQFQLTRINPTGGTELTGDWNLRALQVEFE